MRPRRPLRLLLLVALTVGLALPAQAVVPQLEDRVSAPGPVANDEFVTATVRTGGRAVPLLVSRTALPFGYYVDRRLAERFGVDAVVDAMAQWDGIPGARWSTRYLGIVAETEARAAADGRSVVFLDPDCTAEHGGHAHRQLDTAVRDDAYGGAAVLLTEVDIGVCEAVRGPRGLRAVLAHEVGHALGLDHLTAQESGACRVMYHGSSGCWPQVDARDHVAVRHLYPALPRLAGPTREETAARASYATVDDRSARTVVVARSDETAHGPLAAAALAAGLDAPLLLARPSRGRCFEGPAATELARARYGLARVVLVGDWPSGCRNALLLRAYRSETITGPGPAGLSVAVAERLASARRLGDAAVLVSSAVDGRGHVPDGVAGGAAAAAASGPVLFTRSDALSPPVADWLGSAPGLRRVYALGGAAVISEPVLDEVRRLGLEVVRVAGGDRVGTALALADRPELFAPDAPVIVAGTGGWPDAVTGSALGGRLAAPVLLTGQAPDWRINRWLAARRPPSGYVVGGHGAVPYAAQWAYTRNVGR